jgi:hypothetical protein
MEAGWRRDSIWIGGCRVIQSKVENELITNDE